MISKKKEKDIVENFYNSFYSEPKVIGQFVHPEASLCWHSSTGFSELDYNGIANLAKEMSESFESLRTDISTILKEKNKVAIHFDYHVKTIENPDEEITLGHFMAIWELKDNKLYKGYMVSQPAR